MGMSHWVKMALSPSYRQERRDAYNVIEQGVELPAYPLDTSEDALENYYDAFDEAAEPLHDAQRVLISGTRSARTFISDTLTPRVAAQLRSEIERFADIEADRLISGNEYFNSVDAADDVALAITRSVSYGHSVPISREATRAAAAESVYKKTVDRLSDIATQGDIDTLAHAIKRYESRSLPALDMQTSKEWNDQKRAIAFAALAGAGIVPDEREDETLLEVYVMDELLKAAKTATRASTSIYQNATRGSALRGLDHAMNDLEYAWDVIVQSRDALEQLGVTVKAIEANHLQPAKNVYGAMNVLAVRNAFADVPKNPDVRDFSAALRQAHTVGKDIAKRAYARFGEDTSQLEAGLSKMLEMQVNTLVKRSPIAERGEADLRYVLCELTGGDKAEWYKTYAAPNKGNHNRGPEPFRELPERELGEKNGRGPKKNRRKRQKILR